MKRTANEKEVGLLAKDYKNGVSLNRVSAKYKVSKITARKLLTQRGVEIRQKLSYTVNENFFETIDTEEKAYFLGWMYADGNNDQTRNTSSMNLQEKDRDILEILNKFVNQDRPLLFISGKGKRQNQYRLTITSKKICEDLSKWGCVPNKTFKINWPDFLPEHLIPAFLRGIWEGDGTIAKKETSLTTTQNLAERLHVILKEKLQINSLIYVIKHSPKVRQLRITERNQAKKFLEWIYEGATIFLERKYLAYIEMLKYQAPMKWNTLLNPDGTKLTSEQHKERTREQKRLNQAKLRKRRKDSVSTTY